MANEPLHTYFPYLTVDLWIYSRYRQVGADKDYLASSIAYRLDLHGTAEVIQTACSSALVAVSRAAQHLKADHCAACRKGLSEEVFGLIPNATPHD